MSTTPSRCRQRASVSTTRPRTRTRADNARPHPRGAPAPGPGALRTRPTTPAARGNARTRARLQADCSGSRSTPSEYAHKDPDLRNTNRTQGRNQALVCGPVLPNSLPCVRHQRTRTPKRDGAKEQTHQLTANSNQQTGQPAKKGTVNRIGPRPHPFAGTPWAPQAAGGPPTPPGEPRPQRRPTAVASPRGAGRRCHP